MGGPKAAQCLDTASYAEESRRLQLTAVEAVSPH